MQLVIFALFLATLLTSTGCMHVRNAPSPEESYRILSEGDLPLVNQATAGALISSSKVPVAIMLTADWCKLCSSVKGEYWRTVRRNQQRFVGVTLDVDRNKEFYEKHGSPGLPALLIYERGSERWAPSGYHDFLRAIKILKENQDGFISGLSSSRDAQSKSTAKVFLVAASADSANFLQEVNDQYNYWKARGLKDSEISCYWSVPNFRQYYEDSEQFKALGAFGSTCLKADLRRIAEDWKSASGQRKDGWMYLYVTSHGATGSHLKTVIKRLETEKLDEPVDTKAYECRQFGEPHLIFDAVTDKSEAVEMSSLYHRMAKACSTKGSGVSLLTKDKMNELLVARSNKNTVVVLQACHSGAVIPNSLPARTTILAAASPERSSFGCDSGSERTVYGASLLAALNSLQPDPADHKSWINVHDQTVEAVNAAEAKLGLKPHQFSRPMIASGSIPQAKTK